MDKNIRAIQQMLIKINLTKHNEMLNINIYDIVTPVTRLPGRANLRFAHQGHYTMCRALPLDLASDLLLSLALRLGTVCHLS